MYYVVQSPRLMVSVILCLSINKMMNYNEAVYYIVTNELTFIIYTGL